MGSGKAADKAGEGRSPVSLLQRSSPEGVS